MVAGPGSRDLRVVAALRLVEPLCDKALHGVCGARDDRRRVVLGREVREDVVGERTAVAPSRAADADAQAQEVRRAELAVDRAQAVVTREPAAEARLQAAE